MNTDKWIFRLFWVVTITICAFGMYKSFTLPRPIQWVDYGFRVAMAALAVFMTALWIKHEDVYKD